MTSSPENTGVGKSVVNKCDEWCQICGVAEKVNIVYKVILTQLKVVKNNQLNFRNL